jgi:phosphinothricin acetyltransferase
MDIRPARDEDIPHICEIYNHYIRHTTVTFEEEALSVAQMQARVAIHTAMYPWLVGSDGGEVMGYAYASKWKERVAYRRTAEATIYLREGRGGQGRGKALYGALLSELDRLGCHVVLGCIAIPNEVGFKHGRWLDVGYWQRLASD